MENIIRGLGNAIALDYDWKEATFYWSDILINGAETSTIIYAFTLGISNEPSRRVSISLRGEALDLSV